MLVICWKGRSGITKKIGIFLLSTGIAAFIFIIGIIFKGVFVTLNNPKITPKQYADSKKHSGCLFMCGVVFIPLGIVLIMFG